MQAIFFSLLFISGKYYYKISYHREVKLTKGRVIYPALFVLLCLSAYCISMLETSGSVFSSLKNSEYDYLKKKAAERFPKSNFLRVYIERLPDESAFQFFYEVDKCSQYFQQLEWTDLVVSPTRIQNIDIDSMSIKSEIIYDEGVDSAGRLDMMLRTTPVFSRLFLSNDSSGCYIYLFYPEGAWSGSCYKDIERFVERYEQRIIFPMGMVILEEHLSRLAITELGKLGIIAVIIILIVEIIIFRSLLYGFLFSLVSFVPAVYVMSLFPLFKIPFSVFLIPVPILSMILSTTYTLHIISYSAKRPELPVKENLISVFPVVSAAAATTLLGFATMLFSSMDRIQHLGLLMTFSVILSLLVAWLALPPMIPGYLRKVNSSIGHRALPISKLAAAGLLLISVAGIYGIFQFDEQRFFLDLTVRKNALSEYMKNSQRVTGAGDQFEVIIDTGKEYEFISPENYHTLISVQKEAESLPYARALLSITDLTDWINGRIEGSTRPVSPETDVETGESLELLFSSDSGFNPESLITNDYSAVKIQIPISTAGSGRWKSDLVIQDVRREIYRLFKNRFPEADIIILSDAIKMEESINSVKSGIFSSLLFFYPIVFLFLMVLFKSPVYGLIAILPSLFSSLLYLGLMGYFNLDFSMFSSVFICMLIGVCIDDSVVLVQFFMTHRHQYPDNNAAMRESLNEAGSVIIKTTVIIVSGVCVLLFSSYREALYNSLLLIITFSFSTILTLFFVPAVFTVYKRRRAVKSE